MSRDDYITPVGFAREPNEQRRRWIGRFVLLLFMALLLWIMLNRVINPQQESPQIQQTELPGPL